MDFDTFREEIESYLPIDFYDEENNKYKEYLLEALEQNWKNEKYQFCILAANILFMSCICKNFYFLKLNGETISYDTDMKPKIFEDANTMFDLSEYDEKKSIYACLKTLHIHINDIDDAKQIIDKRNHCAHVCGKIQYEQRDTQHFFENIISKLELTQKKCNEKIVKKLFKEFNDYINSTQDVKLFVLEVLKKYSLSVKECKAIKEVIYRREGNIITDDLLKCLLYYHIGKILESYGQAEKIDDDLITDLRNIISKDNSQKDNILATVESDFSNNKIEFWETIPFDEINRIFNAPKTPTPNNKTIDIWAGDFISGEDNSPLSVFRDIVKGDN